MGLLALFGGSFTPYSPYSPNFDQIAMPPDQRHWAGTDELGRDIFSRVVQGARVSLLVGFAAQGLATLIGVALGLLAGYYGRWVDALLMRVVDIFYALPGLLLVVLLVAMLEPGVLGIIVTIGLTNWPFTARLVRGQALMVKEQDFILAARSMGLPGWRVLLYHIMPNILDVILVQFSFGVGSAILTEASLSFLGIGIPAPHPSWGGMIYKGFEYLRSAPHMIVVPSVLLCLTTVSINLLGDALRDTLFGRGNRAGQFD